MEADINHAHNRCDDKGEADSYSQCVVVERFGVVQAEAYSERDYKADELSEVKSFREVSSAQAGGYEVGGPVCPCGN